MHLDADAIHQLRQEQADPVASARDQRRGLVMTFLARKSYWTVIEWLSRGALTGARMPQFWTLQEAEDHYRALLLGPAGAPRCYRPNDRVRAAYVVARFFNSQGRHWLT